jgi:hypothetical protein
MMEDQALEIGVEAVISILDDSILDDSWQPPGVRPIED